MERHEIIKLSKKNIESEELEKAKKILEKDYIISHGQYEPLELKKAINEQSPVLIRGHLLTGFDKGNVFVDSKGESLTIDKMVKAVIVEGLSNRESVSVKIPEEVSDIPPGDYFAILGKNEWEEGIALFHGVLGSLRVSPVFLPPHSAIFNFLKPGKEQEKKKIVSMLSGVNINVYSPDNYIDNCIHEIGHLFWRDCLTFDEKKAFKDHFKVLRPSAIYEYEWERETEEEVFCTIYKWYVKSLWINKSFYNILEFEEPRGLKLLQDVFTRVARDRQIADIWKGAKSEINDYLNPKFDTTSGKYLRKAGALDRIRDIELPSTVLQNVARYEGGVEFIRLEKAVVPVKGNRIDWENIGFSKMEKADPQNKQGKPFLYLDMDGVVADFAGAYKAAFNRSAHDDDPFTVQQFVMQIPDFFRILPVLDKGAELVGLLKDQYEVIFLTTPMSSVETCRRDKLEWVREHFGEGHDVLFSDDKSEFVMDEKSILVDDMKKNIDEWTNAGGTSIDIKLSNDKIIDIIEDVFNDRKKEKDIKRQLNEIEIDGSPSEKMKQSGNYKKGKIIFKQIPIIIENIPGSIRFGFDEIGKKWISKINCYYGYIQKTEGNDYDEIDCFIGKSLNASRVFVVNQMKNGLFDEHKIIFGCSDEYEARELYLSCYEKGWERNISSIVMTNTKKIREWLKNGNKTEPF